MRIRHIAITLGVLIPLIAGAQVNLPFMPAGCDDDAPEIEAEDGSVDSYIRENPDMGETTDTPCADGSYPFLNLQANHIELNGANWSRLRALFAATATNTVKVLHLGDSHIQAEGSTTPTRLKLQARYGTGGRGLLMPFRLAGTNAPTDYVLTSDAPMDGARLLKTPWPIDMGFTGVAAAPLTDTFDLHIEPRVRDNIDPSFSTLRFYFAGSTPHFISATAADDTIAAITTIDDNAITLTLPRKYAAITANFAKQTDEDGNALPVSFIGVELLNDECGVVYSAIGNNGATFGTYNGVPHQAKGLAQLNSDLIIISLGANESFGKITDDEMYASMSQLINAIKRECPDATLLLTTPNETHKAQSSYTRRRNGRRTRVKNYGVNADSDRMRQVILRFGRNKHIATYDWYEIAGGAGSAELWMAEGLMRNDRIHNTWDGYTLQGDLLYQALIDQIEKN